MSNVKAFLAAFVLGAASLVLGCATTGVLSSPEAQIKTGSDSLAATTGTMTVLLRNQKITIAQGDTFRVFLGAASTALDKATATLVACRAATPPPTLTSDPCRPQVNDMIVLALDSVANVKKALDAK